MHHLQQMIAAHPDVMGSTNDALVSCIEECFACAPVCISCADACLREEMVAQLRQCIRLNLDCADLFLAAGKLSTRRTGTDEALIILALQACAQAWMLCADECERHAEEHEHCRICAEHCRRCEQACLEAERSIRVH